MRGRLTEQLSAAALRTARLQQATSMLAEALTVEQVVEVITEVGRTAIGALRSAVALLEADGARLRVVNDDGMQGAPDSAGGELTLESPSVITKAIATRQPVLVEDPDDLRRQFEGELEIDPATDRRLRRAVLGRPAADHRGRAARRAAVLVRPSAADHRGGAGLPRGAGRPVRARGRAGRALRAGAHDGGDAAAQPAARPAAERARPGPGGQVPAGGQEHGDRRRLVRRVPAGRPAAGGGGRRRHGQGPHRGGRHGPGAQRAARARADRLAPGGGAGRPGPAVQRHRAGGAGHHRRLPGDRPGDRRGRARECRATCPPLFSRRAARRGSTTWRRARRWAGPARGSSTRSACGRAARRFFTRTVW